VGKVLVKGTGIGTGVITGELCVAKTIDELKRKYAKGNILVVPYTTNEMMPMIKSASALIVEESGTNNHAATVGLHWTFPLLWVHKTLQAC